MSLAETMLWGFFGGIAAELVGWFELRQKLPGEMPHWLRSPAYWVITILMAVAGALITLAYARSGTALSAILALNVGASAPLAFKQLAAAAPRPPIAPDPRTVD